MCAGREVGDASTQRIVGQVEPFEVDARREIGQGAAQCFTSKISAGGQNKVPRENARECVWERERERGGRERSTESRIRRDRWRACTVKQVLCAWDGRMRKQWWRETILAAVPFCWSVNPACGGPSICKGATLLTLWVQAPVVWLTDLLAGRRRWCLPHQRQTWPVMHGSQHEGAPCLHMCYMG